LRAFGRDESGATSIEYGLIAALMAVAIIASLKSLGNSATGSWGSMANKAGNAMTGR
jgi:pilus assembly protein Flp/PilA